MPRVSIVMNCLNGAPYLRKAIDSIYAQSYEDWEIIFFDNASTDYSASIAKSYDDKLKYHYSERILSLGEARNCAMEYADSEIIAFLDCDDIWMSKKLEKQLILFDKNKNIGFVYSDALLYFQNEGACVSYFKYNGMKPRRGNILQHLLNCYFIPMPTVMLKKSCLNFMDEWFDSNFEYATDYDLFLRLASRYECDYVEEAMAVYRIHGSATSMRAFGSLPFELSTTIEKLKKDNPIIMRSYEKENKNNAQWIAFLHARAQWREGNGKKTRSLLANNALTFKNTILFFLSFLKYEWVIKIIGITKRMKCTMMTEQDIDKIVKGQRSL